MTMKRRLELLERGDVWPDAPSIVIHGPDDEILLLVEMIGARDFRVRGESVGIPVVTDE
jgi:hypothetical protein